MDVETDERALHGIRVLIVEDEALISLALESILEDFGCEIAAAPYSVAEALPLARTANIAVALLDINVGGEEVFPVAQVLALRRIPFVFASGFGRASMPPDLRSRPLVRKPFSARELRIALIGAIRNREP